MKRPGPQPPIDLYRIVRYYADDRPSKIIREHVRLEDAQAHCNDPATKGDGWFDGYTREEPQSVAVLVDESRYIPVKGYLRSDGTHVAPHLRYRGES